MLRSRFQTLRPSPDLELGFTIKEYIIKNPPNNSLLYHNIDVRLLQIKFLKDFYILHKLNLFSMLDFTNALYTCTYQMKIEAGGKL